MADITPHRPMRSHPKMVRGLITLLGLIPENSIGVEIGSYAGESAAVFAASGKFKKLYCVDPWDPKYYSGNQLIDAEKAFDKVAARYPDIIVKCKGTLEDFYYSNCTPHLLGINFTYIDGNHKYEFVKNDIQTSLQIRDESKDFFLCGHDYDYKKSPGVRPAIEELLEYPDAVFCDYSWMKIINHEKG